MAFTAEDSSTLALQQQVARLQALLEAARQVHAAVRLEEAMRLVLRIVVRELEMEGALFTSPAMSYGDVPDTLPDGAARFPLQDKDGQILTELMVFPRADAPLTIYEEDFLEGLTLQASVAFENARYHERNVEWARVEQDLAAARDIQRSLLPQTMPDLRGYGVAVRSSACYEVGGDYADILTLPSGEHMMIVADVAGKGLASAIMSTAFRAAFRALAVSGLSLADIAVRLNQEHWGEGAEARLRYVSAIFLRLDAVAHRIGIVNAGHSPGFLLDVAGEVRMIDASGAPLGMLPGRSYVAEEFDFPRGARLLLYTDGLTDQCGNDDEEFGQDRLLGEFANCPERECAAVLDRLWRKVSEHAAGNKQQDDMTALVLSRW